MLSPSVVLLIDNVILAKHALGVVPVHVAFRVVKITFDLAQVVLDHHLAYLALYAFRMIPASAMRDVFILNRLIAVVALKSDLLKAVQTSYIVVKPAVVKFMHFVYFF